MSNTDKNQTPTNLIPFLKIPLVCQKEPIEALEQEFKENKPFLEKVQVRPICR